MRAGGETPPAVYSFGDESSNLGGLGSQRRVPAIASEDTSQYSQILRHVQLFEIWIPLDR